MAKEEKVYAKNADEIIKDLTAPVYNDMVNLGEDITNAQTKPKMLPQEVEFMETVRPMTLTDKERGGGADVFDLTSPVDIMAEQGGEEQLGTDAFFDNADFPAPENANPFADATYIPRPQDLVTNPSMFKTDKINPRAAGLSTALAYISQSNGQGAHRQQMDANLARATAGNIVIGQIVESYAKAGIEMPENLQSRIQDYLEAEAQFNNVYSTDAALMGVAVSPDMTPNTISRKLATISKDIHQMASPVLTYSDRLDLIIKQNEATIKANEAWKSDVEVTTLKENKVLMDKTENLTDEQLGIMLGNSEIMSAYEMDRGDVMKVIRMRELQRREEYAKKLKENPNYNIDAMYETIRYLANNQKISMASAASILQQEIANTGGYTTYTGEQITASDKILNELITAQDRLSKAEVMNANQNDVMRQLQETGNAVLDAETAVQAQDILNSHTAMENQDIMFKAQLANVSNFVNLEDIPTYAEFQQVRESLLVKQTKGEIISGVDAKLYEDARNSVVAAVQEHFNKKYENNPNKFIKTMLDSFAVDGDLSRTEAVSVLTNSNFDSRQLGVGKLGPALVATFEKLQEKLDADETVKSFSDGKEILHGKIKISDKNSKEVFNTLYKGVLASKRADSVRDTHNNLLSSIAKSNIQLTEEDKNYIASKFEDILPVVEGQDIQSGNALTHMTQIDMYLFQKYGFKGKTSLMFAESNIQALTTSLFDDIKTPEQLALIHTVLDKAYPDIGGSNSTKGKLDRALMRGFEDNYFNLTSEFSYGNDVYYLNKIRHFTGTTKTATFTFTESDGQHKETLNIFKATDAGIFERLSNKDVREQANLNKHIYYGLAKLNPQIVATNITNKEDIATALGFENVEAMYTFFEGYTPREKYMQDYIKNNFEQNQNKE